jgi:sugar lactone lactonase YvrE
LPDRNLYPKISTMKKALPAIIFLLFLISFDSLFAQAPAISYSSPQTFIAGKAITALAPTSSGVAVAGYSNSPVTLGSGFTGPDGVAVDAAGNIYVADEASSIIKIPAGGGSRVQIGSGFSNPRGVAVDVAGNVYVADPGGGAIYKIPAGGGVPATLGSGFSYPTCIAVDITGNVYVGDAYNDAVYKIPAGGRVPVMLGSGFNYPSGIAVDGVGNVYVAAEGNTAVIKIPVGGGNSVRIGSGFNSLQGVAVDAAGNVFAADYGGNTIVKIPADGTAEVEIGSGLDNPVSIALDAAGNIYVADQGGGNHALKKIQPVGGYYIGPFLPVGLNFDSATGTISGTPTAASPATNYIITAYNSSGSTAATLSITINSVSVPSISYNSSQTYTAGKAITALAPVSSGVATVSYNNNPVTLGSRFTGPDGLAVDATGNIYVADEASGIIKIPAGGGSRVQIGSGFNFPRGVAVDVAGNVYVADPGGGTVYKIPAGGSAPVTLSSAGGTYPTCIAVDAAGSVYVGDAGNGTVYKIPVGGSVPVTLGSGIIYPSGIAVDGAGNVYVADKGSSKVIKIPAGGANIVQIGSGFLGPEGVAVDAAGNVYVAPSGGTSVVKIPADGTTPVAIGSGLNGLTSIALDAAGNIYVTDQGNHAVKKIQPIGGYYLSGFLPAGLSFDNNSGIISGTPTAASPAANYTITAYNSFGTSAATVNLIVNLPSPPTISYSSPQTYIAGKAITALAPTSSGIAAVGYSNNPAIIGSGFNQPQDVAVDAAGNVYVADEFNSAVKKIPVGGGATVSIGSGFNKPGKVTVDAAGNVYVSDFGNSAVYKIPAGGGATVSIGSGFNGPGGVAVDGAGNVYVTEYNSGTVKKIAAGGGSPVTVGSGFNNPIGLAVDAAGNLYVTSETSNTVTKIPAGGGSQVIIGSGFNKPESVAVDAVGNIYIADQNNNVVKEIPVGGGSQVTISTGFSGPDGVAIDATGNIYVADQNNNAIKKVQPVGGYYLSAPLPAGLSFDNTTGIISGTPTAISPATNYTITAYNTSGSITATVSIAVNAAGSSPAITSVSPATGPVGTLVTITGANLSSPTAFSIGGAAAIVVSNTGTQLVGMVMPGAVTGAVSLTTAGGTVTGSNFTVTATQYPNVQQGNKLVGTGDTVPPHFGNATTISADGNTAVVGGAQDNAAWIYTRSGGTWTQQGTKLVGTGNISDAEQGISVSLSADGNTAIVGGYLDNSGQGAAWVYTRSGTTWTQQGTKLVGTGNTGGANQGISVSLSADGNTAIVGGWADNSNQGAAWIFTRSGTTWTQQGSKLVGTGNVGAANQGKSVSLSADGNTAIVGGYNDNSNQGGVWIYTRSGGTWTQQSAKLVGTGNAGAANQGGSVSLSADGNTAIVGGGADNSNQGAVWIYTRSGGTWTQQGAKLVGTGNTGPAQQGYSISLSADGNIAIVGGELDNSNQGAVWIYTRSAGTWTQQGTKLVGTGNAGAANQGWSVSLSADGNTAIVGGPIDNARQGAAWAYIAAPSLTIASFSPTSAGAGSIVTLTGTGLTGATAVSFGGTAATSFTVVSDTQITAVVGAGASGNVSITTPGGTVLLAGFTIIAAPNISYPATQTYTVNTAITALSPTNSGGAVPATVYGQVATLAGSGTRGSANGTGTAASFKDPLGVATDASGNVYVADASNNLIRKISPAGVVSTFAGSGQYGSANGTGTAASFGGPFGVATDASGNVYVGDSGNNLIRKISPAGVVSTLAGSGQIGASNGTGTAASFNYPAGLATDASGNVYVGDPGNQLIRKISPAGVVSTLAGSGQIGASNGTGTAASFYFPYRVATDASGNVYVADGGNNLIRKISPAGVVSTLAGSGQIGASNGTGIAASFNNPSGVATDASGNVYVGDQFNNLIRKISPAGVVSTLAGSGSPGASNGTDTAASFYHPVGIATDASGNVYVDDYGNNLIRKIIISGYNISPALPAGLSFDGATGAISGTPTAVSPATNYTITAYNNLGSSSATVSITVQPQAVITFQPLPFAVYYGSADIAPGATSTNTTIPITYFTSDATVVAITSSGNIHIVGAGTATITALQTGSTAAPVVQTLTVSPAALTITADNQTKTYGAANPALTVSYAGFVNGDDATKLSTPPVVATTATASSPAGTYPITPSGAVSANYTFSYTAGTLTITPVALTVTADNQTKVYGAANPALTVSYTGFVNGDDATKLSTPPVVITMGTASSAIGTYPITASGAVSPNYTFTYAAGILTVTQATLTITADNKTKYYSDTNPSLTLSYTGFVNGDTQATLTTQATASTTATDLSPAGTYPITASGASVANYAINYVAGTLTINPAPAPTVTAMSNSAGITGSSITITGTYFMGATAVTFGGTPAASFTVNSATSITAVVGAGASGAIAVTTPTGTGSLAGFTYQLTLPQTNFKLTITSATCKGSGNGSVNITAAQALNYVATITGNGLNTPYPFTTSAEISSLAAGSYSVCITVTGQPGYQQCFNVDITEPKDLSVYAVVNPSDNTLALALSGGMQYNIQLNGSSYTTTQSSITLPLKFGDNDLMVTTDRLCQGTIRKTINVARAIVPYPVPFQTNLNLNLGINNVNNVALEIHNVSDGKLVFSKQYTNQSGVLQLDLSDLKGGVYALHLSMDNFEKIFKIMKK